MALFMDGGINTLEDLRHYESGILDTAGYENINLTAKMALAQDEMASDILLFLLREEKHGTSASCPVLGFDSGQRRRHRGVSDVVTTSALRRWHAFKTLALAYQDAYYNQLNDRYEAKWQQYGELSRQGSEQYYRIGVGLALDPMRKAVPPLLLSTAGSSAAATYYVQVSFVNAAGQEGTPSDIVALLTAQGTQLVVNASGSPTNAVGWNAYVGIAPESVTRQNISPIAIGTAWTMPATGLIFGRPPGNGQMPDHYVVNDQKVSRG
jgi:hypothetical protein